MKKHYILTLLLSVTLVAITLSYKSTNVVVEDASIIEIENELLVVNDVAAIVDIKPVINEPNEQMTTVIEGKTINTKDVKSDKQHEVVIASRGISPTSQNRRRVEFYITYYSNINDSLNGGHNDKKGKKLISHDMPVVALPKDVPYGSMVVFDEKVNGSEYYLNVDTGGMIKWLNSEKTKCKADIFIPNVSERYIIKNYENKVVYGWLYYK